MRAGDLGTSGVRVTALGLGTAQLGDLYETVTQDRATAIVDAAWDAGIRYFDTAPHYGLGLAEKRLGLALHSRPREHYVLSSKVGRLIRPGSDGEPTRRWDFTEAGIRRSIEESLERMGLDRLDIALLHDPQERLTDALDDGLPALVRLRDEGVVDAIGVGTGDMAALTAFATRDELDAIMIAGRYTLLEQPALTEVIPAARAAGISVLNAGVFNSGMLAQDHPGPDARYEYAMAPPQLLARARQLADHAATAGTTLPRAALAYAARDPLVASVVVGADSAEQVVTTAHMAQDSRPLDGLWDALVALGLIPA
ncbi:D-threo-aldose 1-dehydrogenase [Actinacidiphila yanglinensis]|uniref:D-threo-aldose 1-dehydrogenase n=1 Tax=Actinacidiphila yanglinensis TaxID=310779 RepID=A0A1H6DIE0_9ACTN|nr:aldo/keto reductase [Actinacidiphila yanglinensis]SEG84623.1 D-threo-aldose 1-dehydrogenase [Actinacidiphila yanglinensis]